MVKSKKKTRMSTRYARYNYKFFTDYWVIIVLFIFYLALRLDLLPEVYMRFYAPIVIMGVKVLWTKTSNIKIFSDKLIFHHKELPNYLREEMLASNIEKITFKTFTFSFSEKEYCLITRKQGTNKDILINISHFAHARRVKEHIIDFAKNNGVKLQVF